MSGGFPRVGPGALRISSKFGESGSRNLPREPAWPSRPRSPPVFPPVLGRAESAGQARAAPWGGSRELPSLGNGLCPVPCGAGCPGPGTPTIYDVHVQQPTALLQPFLWLTPSHSFKARLGVSSLQEAFLPKTSTPIGGIITWGFFFGGGVICSIPHKFLVSYIRVLYWLNN